MKRVRIIAVILLNNNKLVKTVKFRKERYIGDPINAVKIFNEKEVDELIILDISASKKKKAPNIEKIYNIVGEAFMPIGYGGGITNLAQIKEILYSGVEKIILNSTILKDLTLIEEASRLFGAQSIVASIDVKRNLFGKKRVYDHVKGKTTRKNVINFAKEVENAGAGEIFLNVVDKDGTYTGFDIDIIKEVSEAVDIPIVSCGGASKIDDFYLAVKKGKASAVAAGSMFVFKQPHNAVLISYPEKKELFQLYSRLAS